MNKMISRKWLEQHREQGLSEFAVAGSGDLSAFEARIKRAESTQSAQSCSQALGVTVKVLLEKERLDPQALAQLADVSEPDLNALLAGEAVPSMRLISRVSRALHVSPSKLATIAGLGSVGDACNDEVMLRYATLSIGLESLSPDQRQLISDFVGFLAEE